MFKKIIILMTIFAIYSCGEDVVEITSDPIPNEIDNVFEVNLVGLPHDEDDFYIPEVDFTINGLSVSADETGFFHLEKQLVGNSGMVITAQKENYLPIHKRIYHHNTLEDIIVDISLPKAPEAQSVGADGLEYLDDNNIKVIIESEDLSTDSELIFYSNIIENDEGAHIDNLIDEARKKLLYASVLLYIDIDNPLVSGKSLDIEILSNNLDNNNSELFYYDESKRSWVRKEIINQSTEITRVEIDQFGWWAIGNAQDAVYGTLGIDQLGQPISQYRTEIKNSTTGFNTEELYTSKEGKISKYWPVDQPVELSFQNSMALIEVSFSSIGEEKIESIDEEVNISLDGKVLACDLELESGYVTITGEGQHSIVPIANGEFIGYTSGIDETIKIGFYNTNYELLSSQIVGTLEWRLTKASFVACEKSMSVGDDQSILTDFETCRIKVNPFESLIIGEGQGESVFMASFSGDQVGEYSGLLFSNVENEFDGTAISPMASLDIQLYDEVSKTVAGKIKGVFNSGVPLDISFIGHIE